MLPKQLGLHFPFIQAPMAGGWTTPALLAAVAEAGALGMLAWARLTADQMREQIAELRRRTARPVGVNFLIPRVSLEDKAGGLDHAMLSEIRRRLGLPDPAHSPLRFGTVDEGIDIALEAGFPIVSFAMGSPAPYVERLHAEGVFVIGSVTTVADAEEAEMAGVDAIVAQGAEAGGHRSTFGAIPPAETPLIGTMALIPQVVDAVRVPVIAAGGIMDGRGVVAALALGAQAAQLGTRFLLAEEAGTPPAYRRRLLAAVETDTVVTAARRSGTPPGPAGTVRRRNRRRAGRGDGGEIGLALILSRPLTFNHSVRISFLVLDSIRAFVNRKIVRPTPAAPDPRTPGPSGVQVAACALLLELAHADGEFSPAERTHIEGAVGRHFGLDETTTRELLDLAEAERRDSIDHFQFTRLIAQQYDLGQKMVLAEVMWGVILADGQIATHEGWLVRKLAHLLELEPGYLADAKRAADSRRA